MDKNQFIRMAPKLILRLLALNVAIITTQTVFTEIAKGNENQRRSIEHHKRALAAHENKEYILSDTTHIPEAQQIAHEIIPVDTARPSIFDNLEDVADNPTHDDPVLTP